MRVALVTAVGLIGITGGVARAQSECLPECRSGYTCEAGQCVAAEPPAAQCFPECRTGYRCEAGQCVAAAVQLPVEPEEPRGPPRFELSAGAAWIPIYTVDVPDFDEAELGTTLGGRTLTVGAQLMVRRGDSNSWWGLDAAYGLVAHIEQDESGGVSGDTGGAVLGASHIWRIPLQGPGYDLLLDHRASIDLSAGAFLMTAAGLDGGAQLGARLSFYWFGLGVLATHGVRAKLGVSLATTARMGF